MHCTEHCTGHCTGHCVRVVCPAMHCKALWLSCAVIVRVHAMHMYMCMCMHACMHASGARAIALLLIAAPRQPWTDDSGPAQIVYAARAAHARVRIHCPAYVL